MNDRGHDAALKAISMDEVARLLSLSPLNSQAAFLADIHQLNASGFSALLDIAASAMGNDPAQARALAELCRALAQKIYALPQAARATYLLAQTHAINAEFGTALTLIGQARATYLACDKPWEALRTYVGQIGVLEQLGRYQEALIICQNVLTQLYSANTSEGFVVSVGQTERDLVAGLVYQNQGICLEKTGRYEEALVTYKLAEKHLAALDEIERVSDVLNNRGVVLLNLGRGHDALKEFEAAIAIRAEAGLTVEQAQSLINIGDTQFLNGQYSQAFEAFGAARQLLQPLEASVDKLELLLDMADAYLSLNLAPEALAVYHEVTELLQTMHIPYNLARVHLGLGSALQTLGQPAEAEQSFASALRLFQEAENAPMQCAVLLAQASQLAQGGKPQQAIVVIEQALAITAQQKLPMQQTEGHLQMAVLLQSNVQRAREHVVMADTLNQDLNLPTLRFRINQQFGQIALHKGELEEAEARLWSAINDIEQMRSNVRQDRIRSAFLADKVAAYETLIQLCLLRNRPSDWSQAFELVERSKSRTLTEALRLPSPLSQLPQSDVASPLSVVKVQLNQIYSQMFASSETDQDIQQLQAQAVQLEREISRLEVDQTWQLDPIRDDQGDLTMPFTVKQLRGQLPDGVIVVSYTICEGEITAMILNQAHPLQVVRGVGNTQNVQQLLDQLAIQWSRFQRGSAFYERHLKRLEQSTQDILAKLYVQLFKPLEPYVALGTANDFSTLVIAPQGLLHQVPFNALFDGERYLIDRFAIAHCPSAATFALCQRRADNPRDTALVMGIPDIYIPNAEKEARDVSNAFRFPTTCIGVDATLGAFYEHAPKAATIHIAGHGLFRSDNPMFSAIKLHDGWLVGTDISQMNLAGATVTLSACESGRNGVMTGDEILGLMRAFLVAGAVRVVVSLWLVHDESAAELMKHWSALASKSQPVMSRLMALRQAQLSLKARRSHPYFWAPFIFVGKL